MKPSIIRWMMLGTVVLAFSVASFGQVAVGISVRIGPPPLPVYAQPICPGPGYIWTPGYWAWGDDDGYYWVPGTWVIAPVGMLWTPGYWGWGGGVYVWHPGYWGPHVGFYGGINYGFGYTGVGFYGGEWRGNRFYYNRSVTNVSVTNVTNVYNRTVIVHNRSTTSFNGGRDGIQARPTHQEERWGRERHTGELDVQRQHEHAAAGNRENLASMNHGRPGIAATARPADFGHRSAVGARAAGGEYRAPAISPREARVNPGHGNPNAGNSNNGRVNNGYRPFTPPQRSSSGNDHNNGNYNRNQGNSYSHGNESRPVQQHHEMAPQRHESYSPPQHSGPPPQRSSPPPQHSSPPPQHSSPPPHSSPAPRYNPPPQHQGPPPHHGRG